MHYTMWFPKAMASKVGAVVRLSVVVEEGRPVYSHGGPERWKQGLMLLKMRRSRDAAFEAFSRLGKQSLAKRGLRTAILNASYL